MQLLGLTLNQDMLGLIGIAVSVILFWIGYRQTIGASSERIEAANKEVERILVRRIVLESYTPTRDDVARLLSGKARDFRVKEEDLIGEAELFTAIFTRIFESDLIPSAQRDEILARLAPVIATAERESLSLGEGEEGPARPSALQSMLPLLWVALAATAVGGIVVLLAQPDSLSTGFRDWALTAAITVVGSLAAIGIFVAIARLRAPDEFTRRESGLGQLTALRKHVSKVLEGSGGEVEEKGRTMGGWSYDYLLTRAGAKTLIQASLWRRRLPASFVDEVMARAEKVAGRYGASETIIVTLMPVELDESQRASNGHVRFMTTHELRDYLGGGRRGSRRTMPS